MTTGTFKALLIISICMAFIVFHGCGSPYGIYHRVESGDTIPRIARAYEVDQQEILNVNGLAEPVELKKGDSIFIPGANRPVVIKPESESDRKDSAAKRQKGTTNEITPQEKEQVPKADNEKASVTDKKRFIWPLNGKLISAFGMRNGEKHAGIDIKAEEGTPIKAADSGKVIYSGNGLNGYGNLIIIKHEGSFYTVYAHNRKNLVEEGSLVEKEEIIAEVGSTGNATTPHLHFEIRKNKTSVDPSFYLP